MAYFAYYFTYCLTYFSCWFLLYIMHILPIKLNTDCILFCILFCIFSILSIMHNHHYYLLIYRRKLRESQPLLDAWRRVLSLSRPAEQEEDVPVWRTLELHTKLVLVHGISRRLHTDPARLRLIDKSKYAKYAKYAKYDLVFVGPCTLPALKQRHTRGTACQCLSLHGF